MKWNPSDQQGRLGVAITNHLVTKLGHIFREQEANDRGIDAHVELVQPDTRRATGELVALQVKGGPSFFEKITATGAIYRGSREHLEYWLNHCLPLFLVMVDTGKQKAYWQEITEQTVERLPKGWKVEVPLANDLEANFVCAARHRVGLEPASAFYSRLKLDDTSNGMTKRYSAHILVRQPVTRLRLEAVVRGATAGIRRETFHRTARLGERFRDREADVVNLYVAAEPNDATNANWLCRTMWVNNELAGDARPISIGGVDLGDGLEVVWNSDYAVTGRILRTLEIDKQTFLDKVQESIAHTERLVAQTFGTGNSPSVDSVALRQNVDAMREFYFTSGNVGLAPYECRDVAARFEDVMALADNAFMLADPARKGDRPDTAVRLVLETTLRDYRKNLEQLRYEIRKVT